MNEPHPGSTRTNHGGDQGNHYKLFNFFPTYFFMDSTYTTNQYLLTYFVSFTFPTYEKVDNFTYVLQMYVDLVKYTENMAVVLTKLTTIIYKTKIQLINELMDQI